MCVGVCVCVLGGREGCLGAGGGGGGGLRDSEFCLLHRLRPSI